MNQKNEKISFEQFCDSAWRRSEQMKVKTEAVWVAFTELDGLVNVSKLARDYFGKSQSWLAQRIASMEVNGRQQGFTAEGYATLTAAFRDIARRLEEYADAIDAAQ